MSKFCRNCGKELNDNQAVCLNCGIMVDQKAQSNEKVDKNASAGFILGLISIVAWLIPLFGYPVSICGIIFSSKGLKSQSNKSKAVAGLILSIIFLVFTFFNSLIGFFMGLELANSFYY